MKKFKKFVFLACFVMLVALMAIAASAATIYKDEGGNELFRYDTTTKNSKEVLGTTSGSFPRTDGEGDGLTWYVESTGTDEGGNTVKTVVSKKTKEVTSVTDGTLKYTGVWNFNKTVVSIDFTGIEGITTFAAAFGGAGNWGKSEILFFYVPDTATSLVARMFQSTPIIKCEIGENSALTSVSSAFYDARYLQEIFIPKNVNEITEYVQETANVPTFQECYSLGKVEFHKNSTLKKIGISTFQTCVSLESITFPNSLTTIESKAFWNCANLTYANLGASLTTFLHTSGEGNGNSTFYMCDALETVVIPAGIVLSGAESYTFSSGKSNIKFFFTGTKEQVAILKAKFTEAGNNYRFVSIADSNIVDYNSDDYKNIDAAKSYIIFNYNKCEAFYSGVHTLSANPVLAYKDGFDKEGTSANVCTRECGYCENKTKLDPIFAASGYSTSKTADAIYAGFTVDPTALAKYNSLVGEGKELKYGIVIVNMGATIAEGTSLAFNASGVVNSETAIQVEIKDTSFTRFGFTLTGFTTTELKALNLVMSAYVIDGDGNMSYVQNGTATDTSYYVTSVDAIVGTETKGKLGVMTFNKLSPVVTE
ncbi:MAG: leucine-rich repeat domain-containing protein [Eubacteriales bacterium]